MKKSVSIIIPVFNEEESLPVFYEKVKTVVNSLSSYRWQLLFIDDGSKDNTLKILDDFYDADNCVDYISFSRNFGKEKAMLAGFDYCESDACIVIDGDLQDPPYLIKDMVKYWEEGYDDVYCKRLDRGKESWMKKKLSLLFYDILDKSTDHDVLVNVGDFRLLDRKCIDALTRIRESERYTKGLFGWIGYKKREILFNRDNRQYGKTHWSYLSLISLAISGITSFTTAPLRLATIIGFIVGIGSIIYMIWIITKVLIWGDPVAGYPTLISVILFLGSIQLICIGIMGEYLGRIYNETKQRPNYLVNQYKKHRSE